MADFMVTEERKSRHVSKWDFVGRMERKHDWPRPPEVQGPQCYRCDTCNKVLGHHWASCRQCNEEFLKERCHHRMREFQELKEQERADEKERIIQMQKVDLFYGDPPYESPVRDLPDIVRAMYIGQVMRAAKSALRKGDWGQVSHFRDCLTWLSGSDVPHRGWHRPIRFFY